MDSTAIEKTITTVKGFIKDCQNNNDIHSLLDLSMKISGYMVYLAEEETTAFKEWNQTTFKRKVLEANFVKESKDSATKAQELAKVEFEPFRENESIHESDYKRLMIFRISVNNFLESLRQKVSYLKTENQTQKQTT